MKAKAKVLATLLALAAAGSALADTATVTASGTISGGCTFDSASISVTLPAATTVQLNNNQAITQTGTLGVACSNGVNGSLSLGATVMQTVDVNGDSNPDLEAYLYSGSSCSGGSWPVTVTGNGSSQQVPFCVMVQRKSGVTSVPTGSFTVSWPVVLLVN